MTSSELIWRDSTDNIKDRYQFSVYLGLLAINLLLVIFILAFILSGNLIALIMIILLILLDILQLKGNKIQPFEIYSDKIIYSNIKHKGMPDLSWGGPSVKNVQIHYSNIKKLGEIEYRKTPQLAKEIYGPDYKIRIFRIFTKSEQQFSITDQYLTNFEAAYFKLKDQFEKFKKANP